MWIIGVVLGTLRAVFNIKKPLKANLYWRCDMKINVDARGCACPEPVIRTKKAINQEHDEVVVLVDKKTALENVKRFADKNKHEVTVQEIEDYYQLTLNK